MKKTAALILALLLAISAAAEYGITHSITVALNANTTTGYNWSAFVMGGDSVSIDEHSSGYVSDPNPDMLDGIGGTHYFRLNAEKPGKSIVSFSLTGSWDYEPIDRIILLAVVDDDMNIYTADVTESGVIKGIVTSADPASFTVTLDTASHGEIIAQFESGLSLPVMDECVIIYTDGTMSRSLPPRANVICWESVPSENARADMDDASPLDMVLDEIASAVITLANDTAYIEALGISGEADAYVKLYASCREAQMVSRRELTNVDALKLIMDDYYKTMSEVGQYILDKMIYSGFLSTRINGMYGVNAIIAGNISCSLICDLDLPSSIYLMEYDNGAGIIAGIWNNGSGLNTVTANFIPDTAVFAGQTDIMKLLYQ